MIYLIRKSSYMHNGVFNSLKGVLAFYEELSGKVAVKTFDKQILTSLPSGLKSGGNIKSNGINQTSRKSNQ